MFFVLSRPQNFLMFRNPFNALLIFNTNTLFFKGEKQGSNLRLLEPQPNTLTYWAINAKIKPKFKR